MIKYPLFQDLPPVTVQTSEEMLYATCIDDFHKLKDLPGQKMVSVSGKVRKVYEIFLSIRIPCL